MSAFIDNLAAHLDEAARTATAVPQAATDSFDLDTAYAIQRASIMLRRERGERSIGVKLGFTSRAKMVQMGVNDLIWGWLTDTMLETEGGLVDLRRYIHPRVEPEICFLTSLTIDRPLTAIEASRHLEAVAPALEIIDSRYRDFKFSLEDVVADNCSSAGLVVGPWSDDVGSLANAGVAMAFDGRIVQSGSTAAILGHPLRAFVEATRLIAAAGLVLPAGSLVMAGAATAAEALRPGCHVRVDIGCLGTAEFTAMLEGSS